MTPPGLLEEVKQRLLDLAPHERGAPGPLSDEDITEYLAGGGDAETRALARQIFAEHRAFFDLVRDR